MLVKKYQQKISLVIPFYNSEKQIVKTYQTLKKYLDGYCQKYEMIFVNDGSTDKSLESLKRVVTKDKKCLVESYNKNRGRGYAVNRGFKRASGQFIGYIDADLDIPPKYINNCLKNMDQFDGVVVSKHHPLSKIKTTKTRKISSKFFNLWIKLVLNSKISDHQAGLKFFKSETLKKVLPKVKSERWLFDVELLYFLQKNNFSLLEIPIKISYGFVRIRGSFITDYLKSFYFVWKLKNKK